MKNIMFKDAKKWSLALTIGAQTDITMYFQKLEKTD